MLHSASLSGNAVVNIGANTTVLGANGSIILYGIGLRVLNTSNVIIRNLRIQKGELHSSPTAPEVRVLTTHIVLATAGDAIGIQHSSNIWVDHVDLSSDRSHGKDYVRTPRS
jgi:pectate lyase